MYNQKEENDRQKAEIERLQELLKGWKTEAYKVANEKDELYCEAIERVKTTKIEAIKEFAERVKANKNRLFNYIYSNKGFDEQIDNLVKEMVGETE